MTVANEQISRYVVAYLREISQYGRSCDVGELCRAYNETAIKRKRPGGTVSLDLIEAEVRVLFRLGDIEANESGMFWFGKEP